MKDVPLESAELDIDSQRKQLLSQKKWEEMVWARQQTSSPGRSIVVNCGNEEKVCPPFTFHLQMVSYGD